MPHAFHSSAPTSAATLADQLWFSCPSCKGELKVPVALANSTGACPLCGGKVHIPAKSETRSSATWLGLEEGAMADDSGLPAADPELDGDARRCFHGDLQFRSGATQPLTSKRGFFDSEFGLDEGDSPPTKLSLGDRRPVEKPGLDSFAKPLRKFNEPISVPSPAEPAPVAKEVELPPPAPVAEAKEEPPVVPSVSWEQESGLFKPLRKYPPKQRRRSGTQSGAIPPAVEVSLPLPSAGPPIIEVPVEALMALIAPPVVVQQPIPAPSPVEPVPSFVAAPLPVVAQQPILVQPRVEPAPSFVAAPPPVVAQQPILVQHPVEPAPSFVAAAPPPVVVQQPSVEPVPSFVAAPPPVVVEQPLPVPRPVEPAPYFVAPVRMEQQVQPLPSVEAEPCLVAVAPPVVSVEEEGVPKVEIRVEPEPVQMPVSEDASVPSSPAARPRKSIVLKAVERSVALRRERETKTVAGQRFTARPQSAFPVPEPAPLPAALVERIIIPDPSVPSSERLPLQATPEVELPVPMAALAALASPVVAPQPPPPEPERLVHEALPPVVIEPSHDENEQHLPVRIGGVVMPRYTLIPRGSQIRLWAQRAAIAMLLLSPLVLLSGLYMPYVHRLTAWVGEMKRSRISLQDIQQQTAANRGNPAAQGLKKDALAALRQEWIKLTTSEKKLDAGNATSRPVVFRSSKTEFAASNPEKDWPQILLRNLGVFHGHSSMEGGSSFLLEASDGSHWIATSAHLLGEAGGVEPPLQPGKLVMDLDHWRAHLPDNPDTFAEVEGGRHLMSVITSDWLAMRLSDNDAVLPAKALRLRRTLLLPDETVYIVGLPYNDKTGAAQHIYRGQVTTTSPANPSQFAVLVQAGVDFSGFRGAPILDAEGAVVGVLTDRWSTLLLATRSELLAQLIEGK